MRPARRALLIATAVVTLVLALLAVPTVARLWVELSWYEALGHPDVLLTPLWTRIGLGAVGGVLSFLAAFGSLEAAMKLTAEGKITPLYLGEGQRPVELDIPKAVARLVLPVSIALALLGAIVASSAWREWLLLQHGHDFGEVDPIFGRDVAFYVFTLPFLERLQSFLFMGLATVLAITALLYVGRAGIGIQRGKLHARRPARVHLSAIGAALMVVLALGAWLASAELVVSQDGLVAGAGYADVHASLPAIRAHMVVALLGAGLLAFSATRKRLALIWIAVGAYVAVGLVGRGLVPVIVQTYVVEPNELERERAYIEHEIAATRSAFGLDGMRSLELSGERDLTLSDIEANRETVSNIRLWDHRPLLDTFGQIQEIRTYYDFESVDNDRYVIDGELRQTMLSPRELSSESLPNRTWINEHFTFTHGYGLTLGPVNQADEEGLPRLFIQDIPPDASGAPSLDVTQPQIYFGELSNDYVFVGTANREFDHPSAEGNVYRAYDGDAGIEVGGTLFRAALAMHLGNLKIMLSDDLSDESRVLLHRRVTDRVRRLAPFLVLDNDPYLVVREDGTLAWIVDAYTTTDRFPYARASATDALSTSYVRNSVKAVVDAYDGSVTLYAADPEDPILATWSGIFDGLFQPLDEMPEDLRAHLRTPLDLFEVQAQMLATFHMDSPELLYNREDQWAIPAVDNEPMEPYFTVMRLPDEEEPEFILMLPFTPARKDNLAAWLVARNDDGQLGELVVYRFPNDRLVFGPQQVQNRINQDADISQQLSLWDQRGSQADFGTLLVIPVEESLLYVLPLYLRSEGGSIPQLKRVIVVYENQIAMAETLDRALTTIFGSARAEEGTEASGAEAASAEAGGEAGSADRGDLAEARRILERALAAQRGGDWAGYGEQIEALRELLRAEAPEADAAPETEPGAGPGAETGPGAEAGPGPEAAPSP